MTTIRVDIVSAEAEIFSGEATMVVATGDQGELGITPRHAPLITRLKPGHVDVLLEGGERQQFYVSGGILEVQPQVVTVLADTAARDRKSTRLNSSHPSISYAVFCLKKKKKTKYKVNS